MNPIFVDTAFLVALINPRDQLRDKALMLRKEIGARQMIVTQNVFVEALNYFAEFKGHTKQTACLVIEKLLLDPDVGVTDQTSDSLS